MDEAVLVEWLCEVGDTVNTDQPLADIETDKADGELPSPTSGVVEELLVGPGDQVEPGQVVARVRAS